MLQFNIKVTGENGFSQRCSEWFDHSSSANKLSEFSSPQREDFGIHPDTDEKKKKKKKSNSKKRNPLNIGMNALKIGKIN